MYSELIKGYKVACGSMYIHKFCNCEIVLNQFMLYREIKVCLHSWRCVLENICHMPCIYIFNMLMLLSIMTWQNFAFEAITYWNVNILIKASTKWLLFLKAFSWMKMLIFIKISPKLLVHSHIERWTKRMLIWKTTFLNAFSWMKLSIFIPNNFFWSLFLWGPINNQ